MNTKYPNIRVDLVGEDGNAFSIMGRVKNALRKGGVPESEIAAYIVQSTSGDYDNLLRTAMEWVNCDGMADDEADDDYCPICEDDHV